VTTVAAEEVLADPIGVIVRLVARVEHGLDGERVREVVISVAGGRAKRRRLAQILAGSPDLLTTGGPPVPWSVGQLLRGLRAAGATSIALPRCGECGRTVSYLISRAGCLICSPCRDTPQTCSKCGDERRVSTRDRYGRPRCEQCPDDDDDPMPSLVQLVAAIDPKLEAQAVLAAVGRATVRPAGQRRLAWAVVDNPSLLTGAGCDAPAPAVLRFIDELISAGEKGVARPSCPRCYRAVTLSKLLDGRRVCRNCFARHAAVPCGRCGAVREPATRDADGQPLCPNCLSNDPINLEDCRGCGRRRRVATRTADGPWCQQCRPREIRTCGICGRSGLCEISRATGQPWCDRCQSWWARCSGCGTVASIRGGTRQEPLCARCVNSDPGFWDRCPSCRETWQIDPHRFCHRCCLKQRVHDVLSGADGRIRTDLAPLEHALASVERPVTAMAWLARPTVTQLLSELARDRGVLTHDVLDELPAGKTLDHLRAVLVAGGMLPERDERLVKLERWVAGVVQSRTDPEERQLLHRYAVWHHLRRLRRRLAAAHASHLQALNVRCHTMAAVNFLEWLTSQNVTLATCTQADVERWAARDDAGYRDETSHFIRWATANRLATRLSFGARRWQGPSGPHDTEGRWAVARRLLNDDTIVTSDRVAGLLLLLYAQRLTTISTLTADHVTNSDGQVKLLLGTVATTLPEPLAGLTLELVATRRPYTVIGQPATTPWLFPGQRPAQPISADRLGQRLIALGIQPGRARSTALFGLAAELPAAILARMLGIHIAVAVQWQRAAAGDWTAYAAEVSRRAAPRPQPHQPSRAPHDHAEG
jgi:hypothetical protein